MMNIVYNDSGAFEKACANGSLKPVSTKSFGLASWKQEELSQRKQLLHSSLPLMGVVSNNAYNA